MPIIDQLRSSMPDNNSVVTRLDEKRTMEEELRWRTAEGTQLFARTWNNDGADRRTVLLIHGLTHNSLVFSELALRLAGQGLRVVAVDVRGRGKSAREGPYLIATYVRDVEELCAHLGVKRAVLIGTSMGGIISLNLARQRPDLVDKIVLNDIGPDLGLEGIKRILSYAGHGSDFKSLQDAAAYFKRIYGCCFPSFEDWEALARRMVDADLQLSYDKGISFFRADLLMAPAHLWSCLDAVSLGETPVLVLRGSISDILTAETAEKMGAKRGVIVREVRGVGHAPFLTEEDAIEAIEEFLKQ